MDTETETQWYYLTDRQYGPVPATVVIDKIRSGEITSRHLVWNRAQQDWIAAGKSTFATYFTAADLDGPPPIDAYPRYGETPAGRRVNKVLYLFMTYAGGIFGFHRFYTGRNVSGILYAVLTLTVFLSFVSVIATVIDFVIGLCRHADADGNIGF